MLSKPSLKSMTPFVLIGLVCNIGNQGYRSKYSFTIEGLECLNRCFQCGATTGFRLSLSCCSTLSEESWEQPSSRDRKCFFSFFSSPAISLPQLIAADLDASRVHNNFPAHCSFSLSIFYPRRDPTAYIFYEKRFFSAKLLLKKDAGRGGGGSWWDHSGLKSLLHTLLVHQALITKNCICPFFLSFSVHWMKFIYKCSLQQARTAR